MKLARLAALGALLLYAAAGCSHRGSDPQALSGANPLAPSSPTDTIPNPPPPSPPVIQPVVFLSYADSTAAGGTANTRWEMGNDSDQPFTLHWTMTSGAGWPGFPLDGQVDLAATSTKTVTVPVMVPAGTPRGMYFLGITVTRPGGLEYSDPEAGVVRVWN